MAQFNAILEKCDSPHALKKAVSFSIYDFKHLDFNAKNFMLIYLYCGVYKVFVGTSTSGLPLYLCTYRL